MFLPGALLTAVNPAVDAIGSGAGVANLASQLNAGTIAPEAAVLLAMAKIILDEGLYNRPFLENWTNWQAYLQARHPEAPLTFERVE